MTTATPLPWTSGAPVSGPRALRALALLPRLRPRNRDDLTGPAARPRRTDLPSAGTPAEPRTGDATAAQAEVSGALARLRPRTREDLAGPTAPERPLTAPAPSPRHGAAALPSRAARAATQGAHTAATAATAGGGRRHRAGTGGRADGPTGTPATASRALALLTWLRPRRRGDSPTPAARPAVLAARLLPDVTARGGATAERGSAARTRRALTPPAGADHHAVARSVDGGGSARLRALLRLRQPDHAGDAGAAGGRAGRRRGPHAGAWWLWALGLATAASRTTNPALLALLAAVAGYVVAVCRVPDAPWSRSYAAFLRLGLVVIAIRLGFAVVLGSPIPGTHTVVSLPEVPLPDWARGVRLGGRVTAEGLWFAFREGMKLATLLACLGAANALANPARLLKSLPGALYEAGVAVVVAMTFAPHLVADVRRLRTARRLRGRADKGVRALLQVGLPVLEGALERSVALAAAMDARGYGRTAEVPPAVRRATVALTLGGLLGLCAGTYALLAAAGAAYGLPLLLAGLAAAVAGLRLGGRRSIRTRYRPDRWDATAWLITASGVAVAALTIWAAGASPADLDPPVVPLTAPSLPLWPAAAALLGLLPAHLKGARP